MDTTPVLKAINNELAALFTAAREQSAVFDGNTPVCRRTSRKERQA